MRQILLLVLCPVLAVLFAARAQAACRVEPRSAVPVEVVEGNILVTVQVNGVEATFILDTGADRTLMGEDVVRNLGLERDGWVASIIQGVGGIEQRPNALPRSLRLGTATLRRRKLTGDTSVTVGPLPVTAVAGQPIARLLGRDFLSPFDLDLDLPAHRMTLDDVAAATQGSCPGRRPMQRYRPAPRWEPRWWYRCWWTAGRCAR
jgi:hypothetical protein